MDGNGQIKLGLYEHFTGHRYNVTGFGHAVTGDGAEELPGAEVVIYHAMFTSPVFGDQHVWVRTVSNFTEEVDIDGRRVPRFRYLGTDTGPTLASQRPFT
ncbi:DUF1653 domain-containing protein [Nocardia sp. CY41]|uniref:DUF1653 domain-containing protein n=1 Tax=Nocardia sp. CY41 TaxID=2608686 RepID=UPI00135939BA|nr:DUF1653 domain-containing protein [Nocardia sp. CY41]